MQLAGFQPTAICPYFFKFLSRATKGNLVTAAMEFLAATHPLHADVAVATPPQACCAGYPIHHSLHLYIQYINYISMPEVILALREMRLVVGAVGVICTIPARPARRSSSTMCSTPGRSPLRPQSGSNRPHPDSLLARAASVNAVSLRDMAMAWYPGPPLPRA